MAATLTQERFTGDEWSFERKFDGIRLLAYKKGKQVELFSRNHLPQNIPVISQAIAKLPHRELILDGEITWHAPFSYHIFDIMWIDGHETMSLPLEDRRALLKRLPLTAPLRRVTELKMSVSEPPAVAGGHRGSPRTVSEDMSEPPAVAGGPKRRGSSPTMTDRVSVPGADRGPRAGSPRGVVDATGSSDNTDPWELAREKGWEGVIAKRRGSVYEQRRSRNWLKMKCELVQEFVVGGFTDPQGKRVGLGALLVGYYDYADLSVPGAVATGSIGKSRAPGSSPTVREGVNSPDFVFAGKIGTGFNNEMLIDLRHTLDALEIPKAPFTKAVGLPRLRAHWVQPKIVVQVGFIQWTGHGKLRHPRLLHVRTDKNPRHVVRE